MTMDSPDTVAELSQRIFKSQEIVTYASLSAALDISVSESKTVLAAFYRANKHKSKCTFLISGTKNGIKTFKVVPDKDIEEELTQFSAVDCVHIFSLVSNDFNVSFNDVALHDLQTHFDHSKIDQLVKNGLIRGPKLELAAETPVVAKKPEPVVPTKRKESPEPKPAKKIKSAGLSSGYVSRKAAKPTGQANTLSFKSAEPKKPTYTYQSRKPQHHDKVVISDVHDEPEEDIAPKGTKSYSTELQNMFDDDFSDADITEDKVEPKHETPETEEKVDEQHLPEPEPEQEPEPEPEPEADIPAQDTPEEEPQLREEVDEDGYIVSYKSEKTPKPKPATKPKPQARGITKTKSGSNKKTQTNLMSFFGKKGK